MRREIAWPLAAGYVAVSPTTYPIVTYVNPTIVAANAAAKRTLDPKFIDGLVYATIPSGQSVLAAAMYLLPTTVAKPPMPYGALVQWHRRTDVCGPSAVSMARPARTARSTVPTVPFTTSMRRSLRTQCRVVACGPAAQIEP